MKRSLVTAALSVVLSLQILGVMSCAVAPNGNNSAATNGNTNAPLDAANRNANMSATSAAGGSMVNEMMSMEKQIWDALKNRDHDAFAKLLASDSIYVSSDVVGDKAATVNGVKDFAPTEINLSDWKTVVLNEDAVVVTYTVEAKGTAGGQPIPPGAMRASSAWVKRGAEWLAVYHQDAPVEAAPTPTPAAETAKPAASAAPANANTAAKHAEMVNADDPVAIEKHVWEVLKQKDWDAFAAHLAEDQLEVGPGGVYDKAGTLNAVKQWDFTRSTPSDFKATKWDDDVTLVTYTIKGTGPDGKPFEERASSIWVKRGGKWLAAFHMGTPVVKTPAK
jgi:hypothetical protein